MILTSWPTQIRSGDTLQFKVKVDGYDSTQDYLKAYISNSEDNHFFSSTDLDGYFYFNVSATDTRNWLAGDYYLVGVISTLSGIVDTVLESTLVVLPNLSLGNADPRSHAKIMLDSICAVLEKRATHDVQEYEIEGRKLVRTPVADLLRLKSHYESVVARETGKPQSIRRFFR